MLTLYSPHDRMNCAGVSRRDFIRFGALGLGGLTLGGMLGLKSRLQAAAGNPEFVRDKSVVLLFLSGGASHIETFDPKMSAPDGVRSVNGEVKTSIPGVTFGATFPQLARLANRMAIVRSFQHPVGDHEKAIRHVLTGGTSGDGKEASGFSMGSAYARLRGANHPATGMPTYGLFQSDEVDPQYRNEKKRVELGSAPGPLGVSYGPFDPAGGGQTVKNMLPGVPVARLDDRRELLGALDRMKRAADATGGLVGYDRFEQQAFQLILGGATKAFDLSGEDRRSVERYDTSSFLVGHKKFMPSQLGRHLLLARRMCEAGAGFVTIHSAGWDNHADGNNPGIERGMEMLGRPLDKAVSAFLEDIEARGLADKILLVITGDFGRTPKINARSGRDHWTNLCTLAFAGGGLNMGQVIGQSDRNAAAPLGDPVSTSQIMATVFHALFDVPQLRLRTGIPREIMEIVERGEPIGQLV
jgi:uncharacterized protein (DUF1501 family)